MGLLRKVWVSLISKLIWSLEKIFFYPKLTRFYKALDPLVFKGERGGGVIVFDVGANKGQSVKFFKNIYPQARVYAFEPSKKIFKELNSFLESKQINDVFVFQIGLGDVSKTIDFYESVLSETSSFVMPNENSNYLKNKNRILFQKNSNAFKIISTRITTVDQFVAENRIGHIDILKIDVEGFEYEVIKGACGALVQNKIKIVQFERHADDMREDNFATIHELLVSLGFSIIKQIKHPIGSFYEMVYQKA